jgi:hypothetical protein
VGVGEASGRGDEWQFGPFLSPGISVPFNALVWPPATMGHVLFTLTASIPAKTAYNQL